MCEEIIVPQATKMAIMGRYILDEYKGRSCYRLQRRGGIWREVARRTGTGLDCDEGNVMGVVISDEGKRRLGEFTPWHEVNSLMEGLYDDIPYVVGEEG